MNLDRILVYVDLDDESQRVIERAAQLAEASGAAIELMTCVYDQYLESETARSNVMNEDRKRLEVHAAAASSRGIPVSVDVVWSKSTDIAILEKCERSQPDLVAKQAHDQTLMKRVLFSNEDWSLILNCSKPILMARENPLNAKPIVLSAVDPMHIHDKPASLDRRIIETARAIGDNMDGSVHAVHVVDTAASLVAASAVTFPPAGPVVTAAAVDGERVKSVRKTVIDSARRSLTSLMNECAGDEVQTHLLEGEVATELVRYAEDLHADFVVMGAVSRGFLDNAIIGHTAKNVLNELSCDLIVVK